MPSLSAILASACLSGCAIAGVLVLADGSARMQLEKAVLASRTSLGDAKPTAGLVRPKSGALDRQRLAATIAMISHGEVE